MYTRSVVLIIGVVVAVLVARMVGIVAGDALTRDQELSATRGVIAVLVGITLALGLSMVVAGMLRLLRRPDALGVTLFLVAPILTAAVPAAFAVWAFERYGTLDPDVLGPSAPAMILVMIAGVLTALTGVIRREAALASLVVAVSLAVLAGVTALAGLAGLDGGLSGDGLLVLISGLLWVSVLALAASDVLRRPVVVGTMPPTG